MAYQHGVVSTADGTLGLMQSFEVVYGADKAEARDADGDVAAYTHYNETQKVSFEVVFDTAMSAPAPGDPLTILTGEYTNTEITVDSCTLTETNTEYMRASIEGTHYVTNNLPTNAV